MCTAVSYLPYNIFITILTVEVEKKKVKGVPGSECRTGRWLVGCRLGLEKKNMDIIKNFALGGPF